MENLKVGDKLYRKDNYDNYHYTDVVRLTPKTAILKNNAIVHNIPVKLYYGKNEFCFNEKGSGKNWIVLTDEIQQSINKEMEKRNYINKIIRWFIDYEFTFAQKEQIYNMFNK